MGPAELPVEAALASVDAMLARARAGALSFAGAEAPGEAELRALLAEAEGPAPEAAPGWRAAAAELAAFLAAVEEDVRHLAAVRTDDALGTWVGWGGDTVTVVAGRPGPAGAHAAALRARVRTRLLRLQLLALVVPAAARIAATLAAPGAAVLALPIAWRLTRAVLANVDAQLEVAAAARGGMGN